MRKVLQELRPLATMQPHLFTRVRSNCCPGYNTPIVRLGRGRLKRLLTTLWSTTVMTRCQMSCEVGTFTCVPSLGLALTGRVMFNDEGEWQEAPELATLYDIKPAPFQKFVIFFLQCRARHYSSDGHEVGKKTTTSRQRGEPFKITQKQNTTQNKQNHPFQKFVQRLQLFRAPALLIVARCTCFNTYIVSVMPYTASHWALHY